MLVQGGVFMDNLEDLPGNDRWSVDGSAVFYPEFGDTQLHFGITGGIQNGLLGSTIWTSSDHTRFQINYGNLAYDDAVLALSKGPGLQRRRDRAACRIRFLINPIGSQFE